jgi:hypothetical protein
MSARVSNRLALGLAGLAVSMLIASLAIEIARGTGLEGTGALTAIFALAFGGLGAVIAIRQPANAVGWLFIGTGVAAGLALLASAYADYWVADRVGSKMLGETAAWYATISWIGFILVPATFLLLLFPEGRPPAGRWRWLVWCVALGIGGVFLTSAVKAGPLEDYPQISNPFGIDSSVIDPLTGLAFLLTIVGIAGSAASLIVRYRRARGEQRLQIKWLAYAGALVALTFPLVLADTSLGDFAYVPLMLSVLGLPVAAAIAVLRYRLYDIDVVINRTLVYGALTLTLAAVYVASVLLFQLALNGATGNSSLAVAASTLAVAALFRPARSRIQEAVDRRFFRRRYDARQTLETFAGRVRDQVSLEALDAELRGVVAETMQPAHLSLWIRGVS